MDYPLIVDDAYRILLDSLHRHDGNKTATLRHLVHLGYELRSDVPTSDPHSFWMRSSDIVTYQAYLALCHMEELVPMSPDAWSLWTPGDPFHAGEFEIFAPDFEDDTEV